MTYLYHHIILSMRFRKLRLSVFLLWSFGFLSSIPGLSQQQWIVAVTVRNDYFRDDLMFYTSGFHKSPVQHAALDSLAEQRGRYYLGLMQNLPALSLYELMDSIPGGEVAHQRQFGKPSFFKKEPLIKYKDPLHVFTEQGIEVSAEVMQQTVCRFDTSICLNPADAVIVADKRFVKKFGKNYILEGFLESAAHKSAIIKYGKGYYGTCTLALVRISRYKNSNRHEVLFFNNSLFGRTIKRGGPI